MIANIKSNYQIVAFILLVLVSGCTKDEELKDIVDNIIVDEIEEVVEPLAIVRNLEGSVQKGPYVPGTGITIAVLDSMLNQTGKVYFTEIISNDGIFKTEQITFESNFIEIRSDGYYFNEIKGETSESQLTLFALADVTDSSSVNVNLLTHLERPRMKYLIKEEGLSFNAAKKQAQKEVFALINAEPSGEYNSEELSLINSGDDNGILLALSMIFQSNRTVGELTELLTGLSQDLVKDGKNDGYFSHLYEGSQVFSIEMTRRYLFNWNLSRGVQNFEVPNYEYYLSKFRSPIKVDINVTGTSSVDSRDGAIQIICSEGSAPYEMDLNSTSTLNDYPESGFIPEGTYNEVPTGIYALRFQDQNQLGIYYSLFTYVEVPVEGEMGIIYQRFFPFSGGGWIDVTISGGTPPYTYLWSADHPGAGGSDSAKNRTMITETGNYPLTVTDADGIEKSWTINIWEGN